MWPLLHHLGVLTQRRPARGASLALFPHTLCVPCFPLSPGSLAHLPTLPRLCIFCPHPHGEPTGQCSPALRAGPSRLLGLSDLVGGINQSARCARVLRAHAHTRACHTHTHTHTHTRTRLTVIFIVAQARKQLLSSLCGRDLLVTSEAREKEGEGECLFKCCPFQSFRLSVLS